MLHSTNVDNSVVAINGEYCRNYHSWLRLYVNNFALHTIHHGKNKKMKTVEIIMLPVKDRQKAKEFYLKLGFEVLVEAADPHGETWIQMRLPGNDTTISLSGFSAIICETDNIETEAERLKAK